MANLTIEQVKQLGKEKLGREITDEEANRFFNGGELSEEELAAVTGGGCGGSDDGGDDEDRVGDFFRRRWR